MRNARPCADRWQMVVPVTLASASIAELALRLPRTKLWVHQACPVSRHSTQRGAQALMRSGLGLWTPKRWPTGDRHQLSGGRCRRVEYCLPCAVAPIWRFMDADATSAAGCHDPGADPLYLLMHLRVADATGR